MRRGRSVGLQPLNRLPVPDTHVQAEMIRGNLAAHPDQCGDERRTEFTAHQPRHLNGGAESQHINLGPQMQDGKEHDSRERQALAYGLQ